MIRDAPKNVKSFLRRDTATWKIRLAPQLRQKKLRQAQQQSQQSALARSYGPYLAGLMCCRLCCKLLWPVASGKQQADDATSSADLHVKLTGPDTTQGVRSRLFLYLIFALTDPFASQTGADWPRKINHNTRQARTRCCLFPLNDAVLSLLFVSVAGANPHSAEPASATGLLARDWLIAFA